MTEISFNKDIHLYGKFYDEEKTNFPKEDSNYDIIVYAQTASNRIISSLEGFFVSEIPLIERGDIGMAIGWNPIIKRNEMNAFERKYRGKFIPFEK